MHVDNPTLIQTNSVSIGNRYLVSLSLELNGFDFGVVMKHHPTAATETTPDGLASLIYHIAHGASQGQLDPEFVRKLSKRVDKEFDALKEAQELSAIDAQNLDRAIETLRNTADAEEGALLTRSLERLRAEDAGAHA